MTAGVTLRVRCSPRSGGMARELLVVVVHHYNAPPDPATWLTHLHRHLLASDAALTLLPEADQNLIETDAPNSLGNFLTDVETRKRHTKDT